MEQSDLTPQKRFQALQELPPFVPVLPALNFRTWRRSGSLLFLSGHGPNRTKMPPEFDYVGRVGAEVTPEEGYAAARLVGLNLLRTASRLSSKWSVRSTAPQGSPGSLSC
jgi:hypothetical protein